MENRKIRIQTIGSFLDQLKKYLESENIVIESSIIGCNPLAMEGKTDAQYAKYGDDINAQLKQALNIRKNLSSMLSRDPDKFCQNYNSQPLGQNMRLKNTSDYIVFMNTSTATPIYERDGVVYSELECSNEFLSNLRSNKAYTKRVFPFSGDFNWRYYYDKFIDAILREYDNEHIILIRSNSAQWYMEKNNLGSFGDRSSHFRNLISEMDEYFIERTQCRVIYEHYNHIPPANNSGAWFPYVHMSQNTFKFLAKEVKKIVYGIDTEKYKPAVVKRGNPFARRFQLMLSSEILKQNEESIDQIISDWLTLDEIKKLQNQTEFFKNLIKLERFIDLEKPFTLSDYALELLGDQNTLNDRIDIELISLYARFFKLDINNLTAIYKLYTVSDKKSEFKTIIGNVISNPDCLPIAAAKHFKENNIRVLNAYPYIGNEHKGKSNGKIYVRLEGNCFFILDVNSTECIEMSCGKIKDTVDHMKIINDGLVCNAECADALTFSCDYYVEKAREGLGAKPTYLKFNSEEDFFDSLNYIDYEDLLKNEKFVFVVGDEEMLVPSEYVPVTDLTELMDPDVVTVEVNSGLADQMCRYLIGQLVSDYSNRKVIYDTMSHSFNGCEITKIAKRPITLLNSKLSSRLNNTIDMSTFDKLYLKISNSCIFATAAPFQEKLKQYNTFYAGRNFKDLITLKMPYMHINVMLHSQRLAKYFDFNLKDYIEFPPFVKEEHSELAKKMTSCDAVVIHIRRGDYLQAYRANGHKPNYKFYIEAIKKLLSIPDYPDKKYFVFSDDLAWCKSHLSEIGLDLVGESEIIFVEGNEYDESFRDMQLMTYGKIMIGGNSGFFNLAAHYNENCEVFIGHDTDMRKIKKNKYDVGEFTEKYIVDIKSGNNAAPPAQPLPRTAIKAIEKREFVEWLNFWFDKGNEQRDDRILLIGDSVSREYRTSLALLTKRPVDFFATTTNISDEKFFETLELFFSYKEYRQEKAHIQVGYHGINGVGNAVQSNSLVEYEKGFERLVATVLKYVPDLTIALNTPVVQQGNLSILDNKINDEIIKRNAIAKKIAEKHKLPINDLYSLMLNEPHRDSVHFLKEGSDKIARKVAEAIKLI